MRYINNRAHFTIAEIQREFKISRATAIRDINEIQAMGFPLTTEVGRGGGYSVLQNRYLPAVRFTPDELKAIFISFIASKNSQLPYLHNRRSITEKLIGIASQTQQDELIELNRILLFENTNPANPNLLELDDAAPPELNQLISLAVRDRHLRLTYELSPGWPQLMDVFLLHIFNSNAQWLAEVYDLDTDEFRYLPVEMLRDSAISGQKMKCTEQEIMDKKLVRTRESNLVVKLDAAGIRRFKRMHPPGIILSLTGMFQSSGIFHVQLDVSDAEALEYYADWLLFLGKGVEFERIPDELRNLLEERLAQLTFLKEVEEDDMNKTDRMLAIVIELQRKGVLRAEDLAAKFETSVRTIYRDVQALSEAGVPIAGAPGRGYSLMEGYFLPPVSFTAEEAVALLIGTDFVEMRLDAEYGAKARSSQEKIEAILPENVREETERIRSAIRLLNEKGAKMREKEKETFEQLRRAILRKRKVHFRYSKNLPDSDGTRHSERTVDPYGLVFSQGAWVLVAFCRLRHDIRHFRLSRINELAVLEDSFRVIPGFRFQDHRPVDDRKVTVRILVDHAIVDRVQESDNFYMESLEPGEEGWLATFRVRRVEDLLQWTLGWGAAVRVQGPESLRERVREEIEKMLERY